MLLKLLAKTDTGRTKVVVVLAIAILAIAFLLRFFNWTVAPQRSLLTQAPGLTEFSLADNSGIALPIDTLGTTLFVAGLYSQPNDIFPAGTISLVYVRDGWRAFEIDYLPGRSIDEQRAILSAFRQEEVMITESKSATIVALNNTGRCIDYKDDLPDKCEISAQLLFELDDRLIIISADGSHTTKGELIHLAQSIVKQKTID